MGFGKAFAAVMQHEGGYSNNPEDKGGETYMGIARNRHPGWFGWEMVDRIRAEGGTLSLDDDLTEAVTAFYRVEFWLGMGCETIDQLSEAVAEELFEAGVNCGSANGIRFLQRALNALNDSGRLFPELQVDGQVGAKTLSALEKCLQHHRPKLLLKCQNGEQYMYYKKWSQHEDFPGVFART
ncbi:MAG: hypothetical protein CSA34_00415 [Desulfobulbus propionicus]|nr:MAG: hypothetical protein CSA34_00415 [Desulfobulbus propionicus]